MHIINQSISYNSPYRHTLKALLPVSSCTLHLHDLGSVYSAFTASKFSGFRLFAWLDLNFTSFLMKVKCSYSYPCIATPSHRYSSMHEKYRMCLSSSRFITITLKMVKQDYYHSLTTLWDVSFLWTVAHIITLCPILRSNQHDSFTLWSRSQPISRPPQQLLIILRLCHSFC